MNIAVPDYRINSDCSSAEKANLAYRFYWQVNLTTMIDLPSCFNSSSFPGSLGIYSTNNSHVGFYNVTIVAITPD